MKEFKGKNIREVWDWRLSTAKPVTYNPEGGTWICKVTSNATGEVLEEYDTGIPVMDNSSDHPEVFQKIYTWLYSIRDKYSKDNIELRKPVVAKINAANREINQIKNEALKAYADGNTAEGDALEGKYVRVLNERNKEIKAAIAAMKAEILSGGNE